mgnify:CR=1 FL=1
MEVVLRTSSWLKSGQDWRRYVEENTQAVLQVGGPDRARVRLLRCPDGGTALLKDFSRASWLYRKTVGRLSLQNEAAAYAAADSLTGVPRLLGRPDADSILVEAIAGRSLNTIPRETHWLPFDIIEQARQLLTGLHSLGIAHADLGHDADGWFGRDANVLWGDDGQLYLVDLASAVFRSRCPGPIFKAFCWHDRLLITKILRRFFPDREDQPEFHLHRHMPPAQKRWLKLLKKI